MDLLAVWRNSGHSGLPRQSPPTGFLSAMVCGVSCTYRHGEGSRLELAESRIRPSHVTFKAPRGNVG